MIYAHSSKNALHELSVIAHNFIDKPLFRSSLAQLSVFGIQHPVFGRSPELVSGASPFAPPAGVKTRDIMTCPRSRLFEHAWDDPSL